MSAEKLNFITEAKIKLYVSLFEEFVVIKAQIERTMQDEYLVRLQRSLQSKKQELSKAFDEIAERLGEDEAQKIIKERVAKYGGYEQLEEDE